MSHPPLALTQGDPAGIGPEIALKAWLARDEAGLPPFILLSDPDFVARTARQLGLAVPVEAATPETAASHFPSALPVMRLEGPVDAEPGRPSPAHATGTLRSIADAVAFTQGGRTAAVVTNPIAKHVLYAAGFTHPGHTEYLAALTAEPGHPPPHPVMMLWCPSLAVVPVTIHIPLKDVPAALTAELLTETIGIVERDLRARFGLHRPRLALAGLNPHAGESGTIGREDQEVVAPVVERLRAEGLDISGPWPADTMFHAAARERYDAALCMYHDQALIPIKTIAFDDGVNVTLGLPIIRTSPDHGTAFDIAGRGIARPDSLIAALRLADRLARASVPA